MGKNLSPRLMAYRQFLLFIVAAVIVALSALMGSYAFAEGARKNQRDQVLVRGVEIASLAQEWSARPAIFGGGGGSFEGVDIWKVTRKAGRGEWLEEGTAKYKIEPIRAAHHARMTIMDDVLHLRVVYHMDGDGIIRTDFLEPGVINVDAALP